MKKIILSALSLFIFFSSHSLIFAENNLVNIPNNKFGIHVNDESDFQTAANLVNSSGGDWGYVTFVITESDRNTERWQRAFDEARRLHIIPIVRIATKAEGNNWSIPKDEEIDAWVAFLNSLNWVIKNRYVIIGNEPNHAQEWGGIIDPSSYATYLDGFATRLKNTSSDFFVLPAGLDAAARNSKETMEESIFLRKMITSVPNLFNNLDGWVSHSYPNPDFAGKVTDSGKGSIRTFEWELEFLSSLGVNKDLPVFITETGWSNEKINADEIGGMYEYSFKNVWNDNRVIAVTPFILNYPNQPFSAFSWKKADGSFYPYYEVYKKIPKVKGTPKQIFSGQIVGAMIQPIVPKDSSFWGAILARNTGQSIWDSRNLQVLSDNSTVKIVNSLLFDIQPPHTGIIIFKASSDVDNGILVSSIYLSDVNSARVSNNFPVEGVVVKTSKMQIKGIFDKIGGRLRSIIPLK